MARQKERPWREFFAGLAARPGTVLGPSQWVSISQLEVDLYGGLIADLDPMHNDPEWEPGIERWGGTIALGTQLLSMLPAFLAEYGFPVRRDGVTFEPRGLPRVRFVAPLPIGHRARDRGVLTAVEPDATGAWIVRSEHTLEREGLERPFLFAQLVSRFVEEPTA